MFVLFVGVVLVCSSFLFWHGLGAALSRKIEYTLDEKILHRTRSILIQSWECRCGQTHGTVTDVWGNEEKDIMEEVWKSLGLPHRPGGQAGKHLTVR